MSVTGARATGLALRVHTLWRASRGRERAAPRLGIMCFLLGEGDEEFEKLHAEDGI